MTKLNMETILPQLEEMDAVFNANELPLNRISLESEVRVLGRSEKVRTVTSIIEGEDVSNYILQGLQSLDGTRERYQKVCNVFKASNLINSILYIIDSVEEVEKELFEHVNVDENSRFAEIYYQLKKGMEFYTGNTIQDLEVLESLNETVWTVSENHNVYRAYTTEEEQECPICKGANACLHCRPEDYL